MRLIHFLKERKNFGRIDAKFLKIKQNNNNNK